MIQLYCCYLTFCRFTAFEMLKEIKCKQDEDKGKEGRMSSVGGDSNPLCCLPYMAFTTASNVEEKQTAEHSEMPKNCPVCKKSKQGTVANLKNLYALQAFKQFNTVW